MTSKSCYNVYTRKKMNASADAQCKEKLKLPCSEPHTACLQGWVSACSVKHPLKLLWKSAPGHNMNRCNTVQELQFSVVTTMIKD